MWHSKALSQSPNDRIIQAWLGGSLWRLGFRVHFKWRELRGTGDKTLSPSGGLRNGWQGKTFVMVPPRSQTSRRGLAPSANKRNQAAMGPSTDGDCVGWCVNECITELHHKIDSVTTSACMHTQAYAHMCTHIHKMFIIPNPQHGRGWAWEQKH